jgi:hypothetical protein
MSAATKLKPAAEPAPVLPELIRQKLSEAKARANALTVQQMQLAERSVQSPESEAQYFAVVEKLSAAHGEIERLELAISSLTAKAQERLKEQEAVELTALSSRTSDLFDRRIEIARTFESAICQAVQALRSLHETSRQAFQSWPGPQPTLTGLAVGHDELNGLIAAELYRLGGSPVATGGTAGSPEMSLPAPKAPSLMTVGQPSAITPLVDSISAANSFAKSLLETAHAAT